MKQNMYPVKLCAVYLAVLFLLSCCEAYKILVVFPLPGRSHGILGDGVVRHLLKDGHDVTYISPFPYKPASPNLRVIDISSNVEVLPTDVMTFENFFKKEVDFSDTHMFNFVIQIIVKLHNFTIYNENVQKLLHDPKEEFDLVIVEWVFTDIFAGFSAVYNCPYIWLSSLDIHWLILRLIDQPTNPAYTADIMSLNSPPFTFWQRVTELYTQIKLQYMRYMYLNDLERRVYENALIPIVVKRGRQPPSYSEVQYNTSLVLANSHVSLGQAVSIPHNYIPVGGYHIEEEVNPLPENLKKIMDNAKQGVIYFSMGSNLKSKDMPKVIKDSLLKMFGELKQTVLWKFEENLPDTPENVHILNWAPQQSILAHPNILIFITHGGLLSTTETVHFRVPVIAIPAYGDQFINVARAIKKGFAYEVNLSYEMADELKIAIEEVINNPKYTERAKELSFVYHDRPVTPGQEIRHWVRHVIETRGAAHLRSPAFNVPFYQKLYLDLAVILIVILSAVLRLVKYIHSAYCTKKKVDMYHKEVQLKSNIYRLSKHQVSVSVKLLCFVLWFSLLGAN